MTNTVKYGLGFLGVGIPTAAGAPYLVRHLQRPSILGDRLTYDGYLPLGESFDDQWKAKFIDYRSEIKAKVTELANISDTETTENIGKLKEWCKAEAAKGVGDANYDDYLKLCSSNYKTIKAKLVSEKFKPASSDDDFKILFLIHKHDSSFLSRVNAANSESSLTKDSSKDDGYSKVKTMCETLLNEDMDETKYGYAYMWCTNLNINTVEDILKTLPGFEKISESEYQAQHSKWSSLDNYSTIVTSGTADKLKTYCQEKYSKKLLELSNFDDDLKNVYNLCNKKNTGYSSLQEISWTGSAVS